MNQMQTVQAGDATRYWDGVRRSYIPPAEMEIDSRLPLHGECAKEVDPITFEVVRYALLNANFEHSRLIQRLSVSPIVMIARDTQSSILTEIGDLVFLGPNIQYFANSQALATKWVLENRSASPGIREGDMFLLNDPFIGSAHHQDTNLMMPLFVDGALFCWVVNTLHYADVGGISPGSFCLAASDAWSDPPAFPAVKLVEGGEIRRDIEELFIRQSRLGTNVQMDLRAAVIANQTTVNQLSKLIARYGPVTVKAVMCRVIDASQTLFEERLAHVPDGRWSARGYVEAAVPGDEGIYRYQINLAKQGRRLIVDNEGTDPQTGAINMTFAPFSGAFLTSAVQALVPELAGAFGGAYRCVEFRPVSGLLNCAEHPAAVSPSGAATSEMAINLSVRVMARMLACGDDDARSRIIGAPQPAFYSHVYAGLDREGVPFVDPTSDNMVGTQGGTATADGIDAGGAFWMPGAIAENVEQVESNYPLLCLYRRFLPGGHEGAGRHRGGLGLEVASIPWDARHFMVALAANEGFTRANGLMGANPGGRALTRLFEHSGAREAMAQGRLPPRVDDLAGEENIVPPKGSGLVVPEHGAVLWTCAATAGFGDPLLRAPTSCLVDVEAGLFSSEVVEQVYGVILRAATGGLAVDEEATRDRRTAMRALRIGRPPVAPGVVPPAARPVGDALAMHEGRWLCGFCTTDLGPANGSFRQHARETRHGIGDFAPGFESPHRGLAEQMELRTHDCPNCGTRLDSEIVHRDDASLEDIWLAASGD